MDKQRPCVEALTQGFSDSFTMYFRAHGYHWNVKGPDFHEYHAFFAAIAGDIYESVDMWAENIRTLNADAPDSLAKVGMPSRIEDVFVSGDPLEMCVSLYEANEVVIESINAAFLIATEINEQGIADFLASRDAAHKKWRWQLNAITGMGESSDERMIEEVEIPEGGNAYRVNDQTVGEYADDMIFFGERAEKALSERLDRYNKKAPAALKASADAVRAVYRRGAVTASANTSRDRAGMVRVDAYLRLLSAGQPTNPLYTADNDLLPTTHKRSSMKDTALVASAAKSELALPNVSLETKSTPEEFVLALTELSGLGYDVEPAIRAAWMRAINNGENPRERAMGLAAQNYDSIDADLLPAR